MVSDNFANFTFFTTTTITTTKKYIKYLNRNNSREHWCLRVMVLSRKTGYYFLIKYFHVTGKEMSFSLFPEPEAFFSDDV